MPVNSIILNWPVPVVLPSTIVKAVVCAPPAIDFAEYPPVYCSMIAQFVLVFATANDGTNPDIKDLSIGLSTPAGTTGQVQINNSGSFGAVAEGTSGFVLTSNGSGAAPTMQAPAVSVGKAIAMAIVFG